MLIEVRPSYLARRGYTAGSGGDSFNPGCIHSGLNILRPI
jgi:hypothetical protein